MPKLISIALTTLILSISALGAATPMEDCNGNGIEDSLDIAYGSSSDVNKNGIPDDCESAGLQTLFLHAGQRISPWESKSPVGWRTEFRSEKVGSSLYRLCASPPGMRAPMATL